MALQKSNGAFPRRIGNLTLLTNLHPDIFRTGRGRSSIWFLVHGIMAYNHSSKGTNLLLVIVGIFLFGCGHTNVHPGVQAGGIGAATCAAAGAAIKGKKSAAIGALTCGVIGAMYGSRLEQKRAQAEQQKAYLNNQIKSLNQKITEVNEYNRNLQIELSRLYELARRYRYSYRARVGERDRIVAEIKNHQGHAAQSLSDITETQNKVGFALNNLDRRNPQYRNQYRELKTYWNRLNQSASILRRILGIRI